MAEVPLSQIILDECARQGIAPDMVEIMGLDQPVDGVVIQRELAELVSITERDGKLIFSPRKPQPRGCGKSLAQGQWWHFCGETDMGQTEPALCTQCGGEFKLAG